MSSSSSSLTESSPRRTSDIEDVGTFKSLKPVSEETPLLNNTGDAEEVATTKRGTAAMICLLLIGVFISNADGSLVLATNSTIASSFSSLHLAVWLTTSYTMSICAVQPIVGKLSDVFGRKGVLLTCYAIFAFGSALCGIGRTMGQVIAGRVVAGLGGSGMSVVVSILITDLVPLRDVASWRSYVNIFATTGRMVGGPLGGFLADVVGWRWSFLGQVPVIIIAMLLVAWRLDSSAGGRKEDPAPKDRNTSRIRRIDFVGSALLSSGIVLFLFAIDLAGKDTSWNDAALLSTSVVSVVVLVCFFVYEARWATEPIFPPKILIQRDVWTAYLSVMLQSGSQLSVMFSVPLYFQVVSGVSSSVAGSRLIPAFVGNTIGALLAGYYIKRTGRYKNLTIFAMLAAIIGYTTLILRWHGHIRFWETLEIFPGGFAMGVVAASCFIALTADMSHDVMATATGGFYLAGNIGCVIGVSIGSGIQRGVLRILLGKRLDCDAKEEIIEHVLEDVLYVRSLTGRLRETIMGTYIESLEFSHGFSLGCTALALLVTFCIRERPLR